MTVGKIFNTHFPYYDKILKITKHKARPVLIIAEPTGFDTEFTVLPVASITRKQFYNVDYDVEIDPQAMTNVKLKQISYVRTHKQTVAYKIDIDFNNCLGDLKSDYSECYYEIIERLNQFNDEVICKM